VLSLGGSQEGRRHLEDLRGNPGQKAPAGQLTDDARRIHAYMVANAQMRGEEPPTSTVEDIRYHLERRKNIALRANLATKCATHSGTKAVGRIPGQRCGFRGALTPSPRGPESPHLGEASGPGSCSFWGREWQKSSTMT
jgi:hypothetical protein